MGKEMNSDNHQGTIKIQRYSVTLNEGTKVPLSQPLPRFKFLEGYDGWLKVNQENRNIALTELKDALKRWFTRGMLYDKHSSIVARLFDIPCYTNEPENLGDIFDVA